MRVKAIFFIVEQGVLFSTTAKEAKGLAMLISPLAMIREFLTQCRQDYVSLVHEIAATFSAFGARRAERRAAQLKSGERGDYRTGVTVLWLALLVIACFILPRLLR